MLCLLNFPMVRQTMFTSHPPRPAFPMMITYVLMYARIERLRLSMVAISGRMVWSLGEHLGFATSLAYPIQELSLAIVDGKYRSTTEGTRNPNESSSCVVALSFPTSPFFFGGGGHADLEHYSRMRWTRTSSMETPS